MSARYDTMVAWFSEMGWSFETFEEHGVLKMGLDASKTHLQCVARVIEEAELFSFYAIFPGRVPEGTRGEVAEFITRANFGLRLGAFEMNFDDGEVRFRAAVDMEGTPITQMTELIHQVVAAGVHTADHYFPGLMSVIYGGASPRDAVQLVEGAH